MEELNAQGGSEQIEGTRDETGCYKSCGISLQQDAGLYQQLENTVRDFL